MSGKRVGGVKSCVLTLAHAVHGLWAVSSVLVCRRGSPSSSDPGFRVPPNVCFLSDCREGRFSFPSRLSPSSHSEDFVPLQSSAQDRLTQNILNFGVWVLLLSELIDH